MKDIKICYMSFRLDAKVEDKVIAAAKKQGIKKSTFARNATTLAVSECKWNLEDDDTDMWATSCGQSFVLTEGTPFGNELKFCCYCGKKLI